MQLPFTKGQFFDLFAAYNAVFWPGRLALWIASLVVSLVLLSSRRPLNRWVIAILAHGAWSALAYHVALFTSMNLAAWIFAALFLVQAALFFWVGVVQRGLSFIPWRNGWTPPVAWALVAYSLAYPGINALQYQTLSRIPTFEVPCPTTIFMAGLLMLALTLAIFSTQRSSDVAGCSMRG